MDPVIGRFVSVDPFLVEAVERCGLQGLNLYSYTLNNPIILIDPSGLEPTFLTSPDEPSENTSITNDYEYYRQKLLTAVLPKDYENDPYEGASSEEKYTGEAEEALVGPVELFTLPRLGYAALKGFGKSLFTKLSGSATNLLSKFTAKGVVGNVDDFMVSQSSRLSSKIGAKLGKGQLDFPAGKEGFNQAVKAVRNTLINPSKTTKIIPKSSVRGNYDLMHVYSSKTGHTVSLRVLGKGKYEFDTLIKGVSSKF